MKTLERELVRDWQRLQAEKIPAIKAAALKAYYSKLAAYQKSREWSLNLAELV